MGGGLMQLVAYGAQDAFLTGNPEITFFKVVYRRHTNFAMESIVQDFNGTGKRVTATISRNGDLITNCWLEGCKSALRVATQDDSNAGMKDDNGDVVVVGANTARDYRGTGLIESIDLEIGGQRIDKHYGDWMDIWSELSCPKNKKDGKDNMNHNGTVPLEFFFCRNPGLALPLIALQYHEVKLTFNLKENADSADSGLRLYVDYIYLDTDERRRFAQVQHNMLIDQLQQQDGNDSGSIRLNFNHPCKELVWTAAGANKTTLKLNGHDRFSERTPEYFTQVQKYQHHTNCPAVSGRVNVYSFALKPEEHQPSGTCNFSRIDNAALKTDNDVDKVYAVNYNVLRIMSGMGGLAFSN